MKTRETKKQQETDVILSEATDGINKVRLMGTARAEEEEEECPWEEIDAYSGRFVVAGFRYGTTDTDGIDNNYHPWIAYSTDGGKTWERSETTSEESQPHGELFALAYGGGRFVVAGYRYGTTDTDGIDNNYHPWLAYSTDGGKTWEPSTTTFDEGQPHGRFYALAYGGGRFVAAGYRYGTTDTDGIDNNNHPWIAYSTDGGKTWEKSETTSEESQPHGELYALAYGGGRFVVAGFRYGTSGDTNNNYHPWLAYSTDGGKTWEPSTTTFDEGQPHGRFYALAYGGGRFVAAGFRYSSSGDTSNNYHPWLAYSTDGGKTWEKSETTSEESQPHGLLYGLAYGGGRFVVAGYRYGSSGDTGENFHPWIAYSTDGGEAWEKSETTSEESQPHGELYPLAYGGGRFVVAGYRYGTTYTDGIDNNYHPWIAYSTDGGKTWTPSATTSEEEQPHGMLRALTYAPDSYCWKFGQEETKEEESTT